MGAEGRFWGGGKGERGRAGPALGSGVRAIHPVVVEPVSGEGQTAVDRRPSLACVVRLIDAATYDAGIHPSKVARILHQIGD